MTIKYDYHSTWNDFINAWLSGTVSDNDFLDFFNLIYLFRLCFESYETLSLDTKSTLAEFLGIV